MDVVLYLPPGGATSLIRLELSNQLVLIVLRPNGHVALLYIPTAALSAHFVI